MQESSAVRCAPSIIAFPSPDERKAAQDPVVAGSATPTVKTEVSIAVLSVSGGMVGVCLTSIGILKLVAMERNTLAQWCDDLLAITSLVFLLACIVSFRVIKCVVESRKQRLASIADSLFVIGLAIMVVVCAMLTWTVVGLAPP